MEYGNFPKVDCINLKGVPFRGEASLALSDGSFNDINNVVIIELSLSVRFVSLESVSICNHHVCVWFGLPHVD